MSIEYTYFLVVSDLSWRPTKKTLGALQAVLAKWELVDAAPDLVAGEVDEDALRGGDEPEMETRPLTPKEVKGVAKGRFPRELQAYFPELSAEWSEDDPRVERIFGPNHKGDPWGWPQVSFMTGSDYKTLAGEFGSVRVEPGEYDWDEDRMYLFDWGTGTATAYRAGWKDPPPEGLTVHCVDYVGKAVAGPSGFPGVCRTALALDLNARWPAFVAKDPFGSLPNKEFTRDLEEALGAPLWGVGIYH